MINVTLIAVFNITGDKQYFFTGLCYGNM